MRRIKSFFLALKASARLGRVYRLRKKGVDREALIVARDGLRILSDPVVDRHNAAESATLACLTIHVEELSAKLQEVGASIKDLSDTLENLKGLSSEKCSQEVQNLKAWIPYLEAKTAKQRNSM